MQFYTTEKKSRKPEIKNRKPSIPAIISIFFGILLLCEGPASATGAISGMKLCSSVVIPSLFSFTALVLFFQKSGAMSVLGFRISRFTKKVFGVNGNVFAAFLISYIGGFPVGAKLADNLYLSGETDRKTALKIIDFGINASPSFYIAAIGNGILNDRFVGTILFLSNFLAGLILSLLNFRWNVFCHKSKFRKNIPVVSKCELKNISEKSYAQNMKNKSAENAFVESIEDSAYILINICAFVVFFSSIIEIIKGFVQNKSVFALIVSAFEITLGAAKAHEAGFSVPIIAFIISFGGLSVLCQVKSSSQNLNPSIIRLLCFRTVHALVSSALSYLMLFFGARNKPVMSNHIKPVFTGFPLSIPSVLLFAMAVVFVIYLKKYKITLKKKAN